MNRKIIIYSLVSFIAGAIVAVSFGWGAAENPVSLGVPSCEEVVEESAAIASSTTPVSASPLTAKSSQLKASIMFVYGDGRVKVYKDIAVVEKETMMQLLEKTLKAATLNFTTKSYAGLGRIIDSIGDKRNGDEGQYWQFWVNNQYIPVGADAYIVNPGDVILWQFTKNKD
jgi:hypothetical protein